MYQAIPIADGFEITVPRTELSSIKDKLNGTLDISEGVDSFSKCAVPYNGSEERQTDGVGYSILPIKRGKASIRFLNGTQESHDSLVAIAQSLGVEISQQKVLGEMPISILRIAASPQNQ